MMQASQADTRTYIRRTKASTVTAVIWIAVLALLCSGATFAAAPALLDAVRRGDLDTVRSLLERGAEVDAMTADGATALTRIQSRPNSRARLRVMPITAAFEVA